MDVSHLVEADLVVLAELCAALFDGDPDEVAEPFLTALVDDAGDIGFVPLGWVDHESLLNDVVPPVNAVALVLHTSGWAAPLDEVDDVGRVTRRPSEHPLRCRVHTTTVVGRAFEMVTVLRMSGEAEPVVLTGPCVGRVAEALEACWMRGFLAG